MHNSLNRVFRLVWNHRLNIWCVAPETARSKGKTRSSGQTSGARRGSTPFKQLPLALVLGANVAWAELPQGGQISAGDGSLSYHGNQLNVQQNSDRMAVDWQSFSIGKDHKVVFNQPGAESIALNRVLGADVSRIQGAIKANGQVFLLNPNGVLFSPTAQVNTGGLVASTLELSNDDFMAGNFQFEGDSTAAVTNQGEINVAEGGTIALIAATIVNEGSLQATAGNVLMGAGRKVTLDMGGPVKLRVDEGALNTLIEQGGAIRADGGKVLLTARAAGELATSVINHSGITQAQTLSTGENGEIVLLGDMQQGQLQVAGTLDASAPATTGQNGDGGFIETSAANVKINDAVQVTTKANNGTTGEWLIDPTDFTISDSSDPQTASGIGAATLSANLENNNVTLETVDDGTEPGDMYVNGAVSWSADTTLSLNADNNIYINQAITATGTDAGLVLNTGAGKDYAIASGAAITLSGSNAALNINSTDYTLIHDMAALDAIDTTGLGGAYALAINLDDSGTTYDHALVGVDDTNAFAGAFAGLGNTITDLTIENTSATTKFWGLFGVNKGTIRDIGLVEGSVMAATVSGPLFVGSLVGDNDTGTISNAFATGNISSKTPSPGNSYAGGLVGRNSGTGTITNTHATGEITVADSGRSYAGGLVGFNVGTITNAYATGASKMTGGTTANLGGLVGLNSGTGTITNAYATGATTATATNYANVGGLVGLNEGAITNAYETGAAMATAIRFTNNVGGLVGLNEGAITNAYATGSAEAHTEGNYAHAGGLVGTNDTGTITNAYATGTVAATGSIEADSGGLVGENNGSITESYWDTDTSGLATGVERGSSSGVTGLTTAQLQNTGSFMTDSSGWDFDTTWAPPSSAHYPQLYTLTPVLYVKNPNVTTTYGDDLGIVSPTSLSGGPNRYAFAPHGDTIFETLSVGSHPFPGTVTSAKGLTYRVISSGGTLTVNPRAITVSADNQSRTYGDANPTLTYGITAGSLINGDSLSGSLTTVATTTSDVGSYDINQGSLGNSNYAITYQSGKLTINKAPLTIAAQDASKTYDGQAWTGGNGVTYSGFVAGEDASILDGTLAYGGNAQGAVNAGDYTLSVSGLSADNYAIKYVDGTLTIGKGAVDLLISAQDAFKVYDGEAWFGGNGVSIEGLADGDTLADLNGTLVWGGTAQGAINAGEYSLTASGLSSPNYEIRFNNGTLTIGKADLQVNVVDAAKVYDAQAWSGGNGVSYDGFVGTDNETVLDGELNWGGSAQGAVNAGDYTLSASGLSSDNYNLSYQDGVLTVDKAGLTVNVQDAAKTYDGLAWSGGNGVTYDGFVGGESTDVLSGELSWGGTAQNAVNAGDYTLSASGLSADNYSIAYVDGTLTVDKADLTVTANDALWVQDGSAWAGGNGVTYSGFVAGDDVSQLGGTLEWGGTAQGARDPGDYTLAASGLSADNYRLSYVDGQLQIISPMVAAGLPYRRAVQHAQRQTTQGYPRPEYVHAELKVVGNGIRVQ